MGNFNRNKYWSFLNQKIKYTKNIPIASFLYVLMEMGGKNYQKTSLFHTNSIFHLFTIYLLNYYFFTFLFSTISFVFTLSTLPNQVAIHQFQRHPHTQEENHTQSILQRITILYPILYKTQILKYQELHK